MTSRRTRSSTSRSPSAAPCRASPARRRSHRAEVTQVLAVPLDPRRCHRGSRRTRHRRGSPPRQDLATGGRRLRPRVGRPRQAAGDRARRAAAPSRAFELLVHRGDRPPVGWAPPDRRRGSIRAGGASGKSAAPAEQRAPSDAPRVLDGSERASSSAIAALRTAMADDRHPTAHRRLVRGQRRQVGVPRHDPGHRLQAGGTVAVGVLGVARFLPPTIVAPFAGLPGPLAAGGRPPP